jgi:putative phosphoesterase
VRALEAIPMKVGVLSDTHLKEPDPQFRRLVETHLADVDKIFHVGDFVDLSVAQYLSGLKELVAVSGNMDPDPVRKAFPKKRVIELEGFRIGLIHGSGAPFGIEGRIREEFDEVDAIVYGHTHIATNHRVKGVFFFNPGSATRSFLHRGTLGVLHLGKEITGEIVTL